MVQQLVLLLSGGTVENVLVFLNGVFQRLRLYSFANNINFSCGSVNGDVITIKELVEGQNTFNDTVVRATGDGSTTGFTVSSGKTVGFNFSFY